MRNSAFVDTTYYDNVRVILYNSTVSESIITYRIAVAAVKATFIGLPFPSTKLRIRVVI